MQTKTERVTTYTCDICKTSYDTKEGARLCESRPLLHNDGVKVGDIVLILRGEGANQKAKVIDVSVYSKSWGHYAWERYWHTPCVIVDLINSWGSRQLTFDDYIIVNDKK